MKMRDIMRLVETQWPSPSPEFKAWFAGSKVVDDTGRPLVVHHGTEKSFSRFRPLSHFGTDHAASMRLDHLRSSGRVISAYLSIRNPIHLSDRGFQHTPEGLLDDLGGSWRFYQQMEERGVEDFAMDAIIDGLKRRPSVSRIVAALAVHGFDGLVYDNSVEDVGSISWVIFRPDQVWRVGSATPDR